MKTNKFCYWLLTISAVVLLFNSTQLSAQTCTPPPGGMVAWFSGDGNANDIQGSNNGTINGVVTFPAGKVAQAFQFDGTGDVTYSTVNAGGAYTVDFWVRPTRNAGFENLVSNDYLDGQNYGQLYFLGGNNLIAYYQGGSGVVPKVESANGSVPLNTYTHVALTYDGSINRLYLNGSLVGTSGVHTETFNNAIRLGYSIANRDNRFAGRIDEVEIFSRALSQTEIQAIVAADTAGKCKPPITFVVNTTSDTNDGACNQAHCSLREAIIASNASAGVKNVINFNIPGAGVRTINVGSTGLGALPVVTDPVDINGYTQPGSAVNTATDGSTNAVLLILLDGESAGVSSSGLRLVNGSAYSTIRGLVINRFAGGIGLLVSASNVFVGGCFIGTNALGTAALPNDFGISISSVSTGTRIGNAAPAERNLISGNNSSGIDFSDDTELSGNLIGTNAQGTDALPNETGVAVSGGNAMSNFQIGVPGAGGGNVISGNRSDGISITDLGSVNQSGSSIRNNHIGTNAQGTAAVPNGSNPTDPSTSGRSGIFVFGFNNLQIGGAGAGEGNLISGNFSNGIRLILSTNIGIQGNLIGTNASGTAAIGNFDGIFLDQVASNTIGGTTAGARNVISGNGDDGVDIRNSSDTVIQGNFIGTDMSGTANLGNNELGIGVFLGTLNSTIGGATSGAGNIIAFNREGGVLVSGDSSRNSILSNSIFSNTDLGIELFPNGVTPNDTSDADTGANNLQNYPVLLSAMSSASAATVQGTFNSMPNMTFRVEFFSNPACDPSGFGEGQIFIGSQNVTTDASGNAMVNFTSSVAVAAGQFITSTATDPDGNTSEFSACRQVLAPTAATVSVGGRVKTSKGAGISEALVSITDAKGETYTVLTDESGYYHFEQAEAGGTYIVSVSRKRYQFMPSTRVISVREDLNSVDFTALPLRMKRW